MNKSRSFVFWIICYILSLVCLIIAFPIVLFTLYPYSIIAVGIYVVLIVLLSISSFRSNTNKQIILKRVLFSMLLVPVVLFLTTLVAIEMGWLNYPG